VAPVRTVHLVAKTHLDVGFTAPAAEVVATYVEHFIPAALARAAELRERGGPERFVWTTGSWLVDTFLDRADAAGRQAAEAAIAAGDLAWHALPFTTHTELCDPELVEAGLEISARLDHRFGRRTIAAKLTDVPGHTRGLVPLLAAAGVELLHVGVNPVATVPDVPAAFRWRSPDGAEVTVAYQAGGYGDRDVVPGCPDVLAWAPTGDNLGPPPLDEIVAAFARWREREPGAEVVGSTMDAFAVAARPHVSDLPVVTAEIGDTWIQGVGTDPGKVARYRELLRLRRSWRREGMVAPDDSRLRRFHENLLLVAEHTWGLDEKTHLPDRERWARADLPGLRAEDRTRAFEASWAEQRAYVDAAVDGIDSEALARSARAALRSLQDPVAPFAPGPVLAADGSGSARGPMASVGPGDLEDPDAPGDPVVADVGPWSIGIDPRTGAVVHLVDRVTGKTLADAGHPLALVAHQAFSEADYDRYLETYVHSPPEEEWWAVEDNSKPGIGAAGAVSAWWPAVAATVRAGRRWSADRSPGADDAAGERAGPDAAGARTGKGAPVAGLVVGLDLPAEARARSGAPATVGWWIHDVSPPEGPSTLALELRWDDKPANRLPEATWAGFAPAGVDPDSMVLDKLGQDVSPRGVVAGGGRHLHAVGDGVRWEGPDGTVRLSTLDAPLVAPGRPRLLDPDPGPLDLAAGAWICLHDNVWGTNFPMWSEGRARFRFLLAWTPA